MLFTKERAHRDEFSGTLNYHIRGLTGSRKLGAVWVRLLFFLMYYYNLFRLQRPTLVLAEWNSQTTRPMKLGASTTSSSNAPSASLSQNIQLCRGNIWVILG